MNAKKFFVCLWSFVGLIAGPLSLWWSLGAPNVLDWLYWPNSFLVTRQRPLDGGGFEDVTFPNPLLVYMALAFLALVWSLYRWLRTPNPRTWLWTIFCGLGLCGIPGLYILLILHFIFISTR